MEFGITWDFNKAEQATLSTYPFCVFIQDNQLILAKRFSLNINETIVNAVVRIQVYSGLSDLFVDFFYSKKWFCCASEETIQEIDAVIKSIYFIKKEYTSRYSPSQRFTLYRQFNRCSSRIPKQILTAPFIDDLFYDAAENKDGCPIKRPKTYEEGLECATRLGFELPNCDVFVFNDSDEILWWVTDQIISRNQKILKCVECESYFVESGYLQKFCSTECFHSNSAVGRFCGDAKIEKLYMAIYQSLRRKVKSKSYYIYKNPSKKADIICSFLSLDEKRIGDRTYSADDFKVIKKKFDKEYHAKYECFKSAVSAGKDAECYRKELHDWLDKFKEQLKEFTPG